MPTALSLTDVTATPYLTVGRIPAARRAVGDVAILFRFRAQAVRRVAQQGGGQFVLVDDRASWWEASAACRRNRSRAHEAVLLTVPTEQPSASAGSASESSS